MKDDKQPAREPDIASIASLIADPSRAAMLAALSDGRALLAGELAQIAAISPQTASAHFEKLLQGNLIRVDVLGRHRYYRLSGFAVAELLETLSYLALPPTVSRRSDVLALGRTCYGHLAGRLGVSITDALHKRDLVSLETGPTEQGAEWLAGLGIDLESIKRKPLVKPCLDWSERRPHLAGSLGVALATRMFELKWIARGQQNRSVRVSTQGARALRSQLGITVDF